MERNIKRERRRDDRCVNERTTISDVTLPEVTLISFWSIRENIPFQVEYMMVNKNNFLKRESWHICQSTHWKAVRVILLMDFLEFKTSYLNIDNIETVTIVQDANVENEVSSVLQVSEGQVAGFAEDSQPPVAGFLANLRAVREAPATADVRTCDVSSSRPRCASLIGSISRAPSLFWQLQINRKTLGKLSATVPLREVQRLIKAQMKELQ